MESTTSFTDSGNVIRKRVISGRSHRNRSAIGDLLAEERHHGTLGAGHITEAGGGENGRSAAVTEGIGGRH